MSQVKRKIVKPFNSFPGLTGEEVHAFAIGLFEVLCPWKPRHELLMNNNSYLQKEYHYYLAGRAFGTPSLVLIIIGLLKLGKELLL